LCQSHQLAWYTPTIRGGALNQSRSLASILVVISFTLLLIGLAWGNYNFAENNLAGEGFFVQWIGIRSLVTSGNSPYSDLVTTEIQDSLPRETSFAPGNPPKYTAPIYTGLVVFPFALIGNKTLAHALWLSVQFIAIFVILIIGIKLTAWKPSWYIFLLFLIFTIFSYHVMEPWLDGGLSIWATLFLVLGFLAINFNRNELAGIALALSTIEPQMVILLVIFTIIWAVSRRRRLLIVWFFITLIFLSIIGLFLMPNWIIQYFRLLFKFQQNFPPGSLGFLFMNLWPGLGKQLSWLVSGVSALILLVEWWLALKKDFRWFLWTVSLTIVISQWIGIPTIPGHFIELILPLILISALFIERWPRGGQWVAVFMAVILFIWEWVLFYFDLTSSQPKMQLNLIIPLPLILLIGLFWVRWWAIKPRRLLIEELKLGESY
jgi:hypothetical protein